MIRLFIYLFIVLLISCDESVQAQENNDNEASAEDILKEIRKLLSEEKLKNASLGFYAIPVLSDKPLAEYNSEQSLSPASTLKIVTTSAALAVLGQDFVFETKLEYDGKITSEGTLEGNLYIKGGGDPTLGANNLNALMDNWAKAIKDKGIKKINGILVGDASIFEDHLTPDTWTWADMGNYYGAGACGLSIAENAYKIFFSAENKVGINAKFLRTEPQINNLEIVNEVQTGTSDSGDNAYIYGAPYSFLRYIRGTIPAGANNFEIKGSLPDPALFCAEYLQKKLIANGISCKEVSTDRLLKIKNKFSDDKRTVLHQTFSEALKEIVKTINLESMNLYAEHCLKMIAYKKTKEGSNAKGIEEISNFLKSKKIDTNGLLMYDGCGLSRFNALTTKQLALILKTMQNENEFQSLFYSLPIAGKTGTMKNRCKGTVAEGNLRAKSGSVSGIRSFAGYVNSRSGKRIAFAIMVNNFSGSGSELAKKLEKIMVLLAQQE